MNNTVHPTFTHVFMPYKFAATPEAQADIKAFNAKLYGPMLGEIDAMARKAADEGKPYLAGEHFGPLDAYALTLLRWGGFAGHDPQGFASLWALVQRIALLPAVVRAIERERLQLNVYQPPTRPRQRYVSRACSVQRVSPGLASAAFIQHEAHGDPSTGWHAARVRCLPA